MKEYIYRNIKTIKNNKYTYNYYDKRGNKINKKSINKYLNNIYIPPAYNNVMINKNKDAKVLSIGIDKKGRKQYIYNKKSIKKNSKNKFKKLINFGKNYKKIINKINKDINSNKKEKLIALILKIIIECNFRIGNEKYVKDNKSYGVSTLKNNHLSINNNKITIDFIGKKGVRNICEVKDNIIVKNLKTLKKNNNKRLFMYKNNNITSSDVNNYLKELGDFTTKNFRTWSANIHLIKELLKNNSNIKECIENVAYKLHHTPSICKKNYLDPKLINLYIKNKKKFMDFFKNKDVNISYTKFLETNY